MHINRTILIIIIFLLSLSCHKNINHKEGEIKLEASTFWNIYFEKDGKLIEAHRLENGYRGIYRERLKGVTSIFGPYFSKNKEFYISKEQLMKYDYISDKRFRLYSLNDVLKNLFGQKIYKNQSQEILLLKKIILEEQSISDIGDFPKYVFRSAFRLPLFINRFNRKIETKEIDSEKYLPERQLLIKIFAVVRDPECANVLLKVYEHDLKYKIDSGLAKCLIVSNNKLIIPKLIEILKKDQSVKAIVGRIIYRLLIFDHMEKAPDLFQENIAEIWKEKFKPYEKFTELDFLRMDAKSIFWENRIMAVHRAARSKEGIEILRELMNDEVMQVRDSAKREFDNSIYSTF